MGGEKPSVEIWLKSPGSAVPPSDRGKVIDVGEDFVEIERDGPTRQFGEATVVVEAGRPAMVVVKVCRGFGCFRA